MLSTAHHVKGGLVEGIYRSTHVNHPCAIWARANSANYTWLYELGMELCKEYTHRYGRIHATQVVMERLATMPHRMVFGSLSPFTQAMPDEYRIVGNPVEAYRQYYKHEKISMLAYTRRAIPLWLQNRSEDV